MLLTDPTDFQRALKIIRIVSFSVFLSVIITCSAFYVLEGARSELFIVAIYAAIIPAICSFPVGLVLTAQQEKVDQLNKKLKALNASLKFEASHDAMTGALNRKHFLSKVSSLQLTDTYDAILLIDVDYFKKVNDTYGHHKGDEALKIISEKLKSNIRKKDLFGRVGGEEFAILLKNTNREKAMAFAETIRESIELENFKPLPNKAHKLTISIGVGLLRDMDQKHPLKNVDIALYVAKNNGRNQVQFFEAASAQAA